MQHIAVLVIVSQTAEIGQLTINQSITGGTLHGISGRIRNVGIQRIVLGSLVYTGRNISEVILAVGHTQHGRHMMLVPQIRTIIHKVLPLIIGSRGVGAAGPVLILIIGGSRTVIEIVILISVCVQFPVTQPGSKHKSFERSQVGIERSHQTVAEVFLVAHADGYHRMYLFHRTQTAVIIALVIAQQSKAVGNQCLHLFRKRIGCIRVRIIRSHGHHGSNHTGI